MTGTGYGLGREYALMLAEPGSRVVVNDHGGARDGTDGNAGPQQVANEISGVDCGHAIAGSDDVSSSMVEEEWDAVIKVHLKGTFAVVCFAAEHGRDRTKTNGQNDAQVINTTSISNLHANPGQSNDGAAKAGIAAFPQFAEDWRREPSIDQPPTGATNVDELLRTLLAEAGRRTTMADVS